MPPKSESDVAKLALDEAPQVLRRFIIRSLFVLFLPLFLQFEFWPTVTMLMFVGGFSCAWAAFVRGESVFAPSLNYWDEAAGHYSLFFVLTWANSAAAA